jgi:hypothetical protein
MAFHSDKNKTKEFFVKNIAPPGNPELLYTLTLTGTQTKNLLTSAKDKVVVLQFFHRITGDVTLRAWARSNNVFAYSDTITFLIVKKVTAETPMVNISPSDIQLGDIHLDGNVYNALWTAVNVSTPPAYILFCPRVDGTVNNPNGYHIVYDIFKTNDNVLTLVAFPFVRTPVITTNPSPPKEPN